jgi:hypothetical protein
MNIIGRWRFPKFLPHIFAFVFVSVCVFVAVNFAWRNLPPVKYRYPDRSTPQRCYKTLRIACIRQDKEVLNELFTKAGFESLFKALSIKPNRSGDWDARPLKAWMMRYRYEEAAYERYSDTTPEDIKVVVYCKSGEEWGVYITLKEESGWQIVEIYDEFGRSRWGG